MKVQVLGFGIAAVLGCGLVASSQAQGLTKSFDYIAEAANAIVDKDKIGLDLPPAQLEELVKRNEKSLSLARQGLAYDYHHPQDLKPEETFQRHSQWRPLGRLLADDGDVKAARGDWNGAAGSYIDAVKMGVEVTRGGPLIDLLFGHAIQGIGRRKLEESLTNLDASQAQQAARRLEIAVLSQPAFAHTLRTEFFFNAKRAEELLLTTPVPENKDETMRHFRELQAQTMAAIDQPTAFHVQAALLDQILPDTFHAKAAKLNQMADEMEEVEVEEDLPEEMEELEVPEEVNAIINELTPEYFAQSNFNFLLPFIVQGHFDDRINRTKNQLLLTALALQAYRAAHGEYPTTLVQLVPAYLEKAPSDVFVVDETLRYKRDGNKYLLYSVGPDGRDDDGSPIHNPDKPGRQEYSVRQAGVETRGDIVFGVNN